MAANALRMRRLVSANGSIVMAPLDHGVSMGPIPGLVDAAAAVRAAERGGATCVAVHKGLLAAVANARPDPSLQAGSNPGLPTGPDFGVLLHLSASTDVGPDPNDKRLVATVADALRAGCDGVSIHVNLGSATEARQLTDAGLVSSACMEWGVPLVAMVYPRGPGIANPFAADVVGHAARLAYELGADAVKVPYTGDGDSFRDVVRGAGIPVLVAGGARRDSFEAFLANLRDARRAGARGASVGRNVFQHADPVPAMAAVAKVFA